jgi:hypothetical protein
MSAFAILTVSAGAASAQPVPEVQQFLTEELAKLDTVAPPLPGGDKDARPLGDFELALIRLRIKAEFGFDVGVGRVTLEPVAEFFWE